MASKKTKKEYWYKKYVNEKFDSQKKLDKVKDKALKLQAKEYQRRLKDLNGEAERLRNIQATYIPREVFENSLKTVSDKTEAAARALAEKQDELVDKTITPMHIWQTKLQGKIAIIVIVGGAIWGVIVSLMFFILNKYFK